MTGIELTLNGERLSAMVEPRQHLGDFLREQCRLTGTHLGCEHGVCGACTILLDGRVARSCIAYAVACDGMDVRSIEGFEDDPVMQELRTAFTRYHALQCGFCTPGMLIAARDVVLRCPGADEHRIRVEMSGNLCRCTGYKGIVRAVKSVIDRRALEAPADGGAAVPALATAVQAGEAAFSGQSSLERFDARPEAAAPTAAERRPLTEAPAAEVSSDNWSRVDASFASTLPPGEVWNAFADVSLLASCLPGAQLSEAGADSIKGRIVVKFGPMRAEFAGAAQLERDEATRTGRLKGAGQDRLGGSRARADIGYRVQAEGEGTRVAIDLRYMLQGALAQFSRGGLVTEFALRMVQEFGRNLESRLREGTPVPARDAAPSGSGPGDAPSFVASQAPAAPPLDAGGVLWTWLRRLFS